MTNQREILNLARDFDFNEQSFRLLMQKRIYKVLMICSHYDFFMLEEDGRIDEQIFKEYVSLNLSNPPVFLHADSVETAFDILAAEKVDLIITMLSVGKVTAFELSIQIKQRYPAKPIVVLTPFSREVSLKLRNHDLSAVDYVFSWTGNMEILLAIVKLVEDKMNVEHDVREVGVQVVLLVENSVRFYSSYLPLLYKIVFAQSRSFMAEGLNDHIEMLRLRGRPKILLARIFEEAVALFDTYRENLLGVISDIRFRRNSLPDSEAGFRLHEHVQAVESDLPFLLQSSELANEAKARQRGIDFMYKLSKSFSIELKDYLIRNLSFGDFVFRDPETLQEIGRAANLQEFHCKLLSVSPKSLEYHFEHNHLSKWLNARALFPIARLMRSLSLSDFQTLEESILFIHKIISTYRRNRGRGIIAKFVSSTYDRYLNFCRIGEGSMGGKARGLAFIDALLKRNKVRYLFPGAVISVPRTVVLGTDIFDEFMESNDLYRVALSSEYSDEEILSSFLSGAFPEQRTQELRSFLEHVTNPLAVRSSSMLEDSHYQPFAGVYATYMIPCNLPDKDQALQQLLQAIKGVYASVYYKETKAYMEATSNAIDEEKMAIVLQELCGKPYGNCFYPTLSGVARSINFYPIAPELSGDGIANIAMGLGKITVEGGTSLRFSPRYPKKILQLSSAESTLKETQKYFYALDLASGFVPSINDSANLLRLRIGDAEGHNALTHVASTYDFNNKMIRDGVFHRGKRLITFNSILRHNTFPLADILCTLLELGQKEMNSPVEIEFAADLDVPSGKPAIFNFLQIRPIVETSDQVSVNLSTVNPLHTILLSNKALGNGIIRDVSDFVYVKPHAFQAARSKEIAAALEILNETFVEARRYYVLAGPGRWGSSDPWLGIPVKWAQIAHARVIVESGLKNYRIEPSQGTHFFQNITSFRIGYFTVNPAIGEGMFDTAWLDSHTAAYEDEFLRHVHFAQPMTILIDGRRNMGVILKPDNDIQQG